MTDDVTAPRCECGKYPRHKVDGPGDAVRFQCCACYVKAGGDPADWHYGCMRAAEKREKSDV